MTYQKLQHEDKIHGTWDFPYSIYHSIIPECLTNYPLHWHDETEIIMVTEGSVDIRTGLEEHTAHKGDVLILSSKMPHSIRQHEQEKCELFSVLFKLEIVEKYAGTSLYESQVKKLDDPSTVIPVCINNQKIQDVLKNEIQKLIERRKESYNEFKLGVLGSVFSIIQILFDISKKTDLKAPDYRTAFSKIAPAIYEVQNRYEQALSVDDMASLCNLSSSHFMKVFKMTTGESFNVFLIRYRLEKAKELLKTTNDSIVNIAISCGFSNQSYFTRQFKKYCGIKPKEFRKLL
ncbi:MAG: AraC family transcriptional regulator [Succinivibrio sp.]